MDKQKILIIALALVVLFLLFKPSDEMVLELLTSEEKEENREAGEGNDWRSITSVNGLSYEVPSSVSIPGCPQDAESIYWVNYRNVENKDYSQIYLSPEYVFGSDCQRAPVSGIGPDAYTSVINVQPTEGLSDIEKYIESLTKDCDVTLSTAESSHVNNLDVIVSEEADNQGFCFAVENKIVFNPSRKVFAILILGHDWSPYLEKIAQSLHF